MTEKEMFEIVLLFLKKSQTMPVNQTCIDADTNNLRKANDK